MLSERMSIVGASCCQPGWRLSQDVRSRAERVAAHELGALEKELQLGESHPHGIAMRKTPRCREGATLEPLGPHAESRTVPMKHFRPLAVAPDEHEEVPAQRIAAKPFGNDRGEAIEGFPHINGLRVDPHRHLSRIAEHEMPTSPEQLQQTGGSDHVQTLQTKAMGRQDAQSGPAPVQRPGRERAHCLHRSDRRLGLLHPDAKPR